jgi:hypothetical protein
VEITNCHVHSFTVAHTPDRFLPWPVPLLVRFSLVRRLLGWVARRFDRRRKTALGRYAQIIDTSYKKTQREVFEIVRGFYPEGTRFVLLPMDMTKMNAGGVAVGIDEQHEQVAALRDAYPDSTVIPFAAVDPRQEGIVEKTIALIEGRGFRGLKLYPPTGYHPYDERLWPLYEYAQERNLPVLTHCSRPASVQYRGEPTAEMRTDPVSGKRLNLGRFELLTLFTPTPTCRCSRSTRDSGSAWPTSAAPATGPATSTSPGTQQPTRPPRAGSPRFSTCSAPRSTPASGPT